MVNTTRVDASKEMIAVSKRVGKAIGDYDMIHDGDRIMVAVSGGKDSLSLFNVLQYRQSYIPVKVELLAVHIDAGVPGFPTEKLKKYFEDLGVSYHIEKIDFLEGKSFSDIDCFWCSRNRRKALFELAMTKGFNKLAFGHHLDDIVETILLNLFFRAEIGAMKPKQDLFDGRLTIIRPLAYEREESIRSLAEKEKLLGIDQFECPNSDKSKRMMVKRLLQDLEKENQAVKLNIFNSLKNIKNDYLLGSREDKDLLENF
ncbi:MAG: ATP-binding protein [Candidatus Omnitrophica bacterium]|nr:ATP-binding protein [Candidatus Omnitrophota bacterium]